MRSTRSSWSADGPAAAPPAGAARPAAGRCSPRRRGGRQGPAGPRGPCTAAPPAAPEPPAGARVEGALPPGRCAGGSVAWPQARRRSTRGRAGRLRQHRCRARSGLRPGATRTGTVQERARRLAGGAGPATPAGSGHRGGRCGGRCGSCPVDRRHRGGRAAWRRASHRAARPVPGRHRHAARCRRGGRLDAGPAMGRGGRPVRGEGAGGARLGAREPAFRLRPRACARPPRPRTARLPAPRGTGPGYPRAVAQP